MNNNLKLETMAHILLDVTISMFSKIVLDKEQIGLDLV